MVLITAVGLDEFRPPRRLRLLDEREEFGRVEAELCIEVLPGLLNGPYLAYLVAAPANQAGRDLIFEQLLTDSAHAASGRSSWPVTAAVMRPWRCSWRRAI